MTFGDFVSQARAIEGGRAMAVEMHKEAMEECRKKNERLAHEANDMKVRLKPGAKVWCDMCPKVWPFNDAKPDMVFTLVPTVTSGSMLFELVGYGFGEQSVGTSWREYGAGSIHGVKIEDLEGVV